MTKFTDGPAHGKTLMLHRAPYFIRVTFDGKEYDALDQLEDTPRENETLHLYRITKVPGWCHIRGKVSGFYSMADYAYMPEQPADAILRDNDRFADWCGEQTEDLKKWAAMLGEEKGN